MKTARTELALVDLRKADFGAPIPPWRSIGFATGIFRLLCAGIALASATSSITAAVLFSDDFSADTSANYAPGGYVSQPWKTPGSLTITGDGVATFTTPDFGWEASYFGFGRALGSDVLTREGETLTTSITFKFTGLSTNVGVLALYAAKGDDARVSQSPYTAMPAIGTYFNPAGGPAESGGLQIVGNTGTEGHVLDWPGSIVYGAQAALTGLSANQDHTMVMTITRESGDTPTYIVTTTLDGETIEGPLSVANLDAINQVGLRFYANDELNPEGGFNVIINKFSATK